MTKAMIWPVLALRYIPLFGGAALWWPTVPDRPVAVAIALGDEAVLLINILLD